MIEASEVLRRGRDESHVPSDLVQFPVVLCIGGMRCLERVDLQSGPWVQRKVPALSSEEPSERNQSPCTRIVQDHPRGWYFSRCCLRREVQIPSLQAVEDILLFEVVPYYLKRLDGVCVLFTVSHRENGKHRGFVQDWVAGR